MKAKVTRKMYEMFSWKLRTIIFEIHEIRIQQHKIQPQ